METIHYISSDLLTLATIKDILDTNKKLDLSEEAILNIKKSHEYLLQINRVFYWYLKYP